MRGIRYVIFWTTMAVLAGQYAVAGAGGTDPGVPEHLGPGRAGMEQAGDITHVKNIPGWSGSDIEFTSAEVVKLSNGATGDPVCVADPEQFDGCARDEAGEIIFQKEIRDFAVAGALDADARVIDITEPANATLVATVPCAFYQNDIQITGSLLLVASDEAGESCRRPGLSSVQVFGTAVIDFSDPRNPTYLSRLQYGRGSHNHTVHPTQPVVYLSDSDVASAGLGNVPIWDISDPANPALVREFKYLAHSPHDITFNASGTRAYVAAVSATYILNTEDAKNPTVISTIPNEGITISHQSDPTPDGDFLLVSDEVGGGAAGLSPGGPVHVYDIRDEAHPVKVGFIWDDCVGISVSCQDPGSVPEVAVPTSTAHVFRINPDGYTMAIAWYMDGVHVVDYSSIRGAQAAGTGALSRVGPRTIGRMRMPNANTWSAKMWQEKHPGYVFANDINRGLDIFYVSSMGPGFLARGTIHGGHPGYLSGASATRVEFESDCAYSPRSNGVDGWIAQIPANLADGTHTLTARGYNDPVGAYDIDLLFYDANCSLLLLDDDINTDESSVIPAGSAYVMAANWLGAQLVVNLTTS